MFQSIVEKITEIEQKENVKIIHAIESGSRAWGFASPDSDFDVRFIYVRPRKFYLRLDNTKDVIEYILDDTLDVNGWDLSKALKLLHSSNPAFFEWCNSPIIYKTTKDFDSIKRIVNHYFSCKSGLWHYINIAEKNYRIYLTTEKVKLKNYFYAIRSLLACRWILEKETPPPVPFEVLAKIYLEPELQLLINNLLNQKRQTPEVGIAKQITELNSFIEKNISIIKKQLEEFPNEIKKPWTELNSLFVTLVR